MRIPFIFWNLRERPLQMLIASLASEHEAAVIALAECIIDPNVVLTALETTGTAGFVFPASPSGEIGDILIFIRLPGCKLEPVYDDPNNHLTIRRLRIKHSPDLLFAVVHFQSKTSWRDSDQTQGASRLARKIEDAEKRFRHARTVLVGDLNMNPFEDGVVGSEGLHGVMTKQTARGASRIVDGEARPFFYNPMWQFFGDRAADPPGTHFYAASGKPISFFWNVFDQVLVRPELVDALTDVAIIAKVGNLSLLDPNGYPDGGIGSDHLPIKFVLNW